MVYGRTQIFSDELLHLFEISAAAMAVFNGEFDF